MDQKHICWREGCEKEIEEPRYCCSGRECGCMGQPVDPPFCSEECLEQWKKDQMDQTVKVMKEN